MTDDGKPIGLHVCWESMPGCSTRNCTLAKGHDGQHYHEYTATVWPRAGAER
ncbi:hypothetical protein ACWCXB_25710 [Streptomyces sp. NPDC001514]